MPNRPVVTPQMYARLFEGDSTGSAILEDLTAKFVRPPVLDGGIDGVRKSDFRAGSRAVIEFIVRRINQASGVEPDTQETTDD